MYYGCVCLCVVASENTFASSNVQLGAENSHRKANKQTLNEFRLATKFKHWNKGKREKQSHHVVACEGSRKLFVCLRQLSIMESLKN